MGRRRRFAGFGARLGRGLTVNGMGLGTPMGIECGLLNGGNR